LLDENDVLPDHINKGLTNLVFMVIHDITGLIFSDQTGLFPITSNRGYLYLVIFYIYDANFIASVPIKNQAKQELLRDYQITYKYLSSHGFKPCLHKMDNKTSKDVEDFIQSQQTTLQYTPPDIHRTNSAEQAICTWKNHFTAGIASLPKSFPIANWCCLTNQCDYTSTCFIPVARIPSSPLLRQWKVPTRSTLHQWPLLAPKFLYTSNQLVASLGVSMPPMVGTLVYH
jgi:hypothetical protein